VVGSVLGALGLALVHASCGSSGPGAGTDVSLVLGIGEACASRLHAIDLEVQTAGKTDLSRAFYFEASALPAGGTAALSQLPVATEVVLPPAPGTTHLVTATFVVDEAGGGTSQSALSLPVVDGTVARVVVSLPCVCIDYACPPGDNCVESPPGSGKATCQVTSCSDGVKNGLETDVDCGGGACPPCAATQACLVARDCTSGVCTGGECQAPSCTDGAKNGAETGVDCGGGTCPGCGLGVACAVGSDCESGACGGGVCVRPAPTCTDGMKDGNETGVDCGGGTCGPCGTGQGCNGGDDCTTGICTGNTCVEPTCTDGMKNGKETGVDCGGGTCPPCGAGGGCGGGGDCTSGLCNNGTCTSCGPASCTGSSRCIWNDSSDAAGATCQCGVLHTHQVLYGADDAQLWSCDGAHYLWMQSDGNFVLYHVGVGAIWATLTQGKGGTNAVMQADGNLVVYAGGSPIYQTGTSGSQTVPYHLALQNDGNLVIYKDSTSPATVLWSSGTNGK
jgi:hypothetical protein